MATALMTGIVAETDRFSNEKTSGSAMSISAKLMAAGANQQLIASKLQETSPVTGATDETIGSTGTDGSLQIEHVDVQNDDDAPFEGELPDVQPDAPETEQTTDDNSNWDNTSTDEPLADTMRSSSIQGGSPLILEPPTLGGQLTANTEPEHLDPSTDPLTNNNNDSPILSHDSPYPSTEDSSEPLPDLDGTEDMPAPSMTLPSEATQAIPPGPFGMPPMPPVTNPTEQQTLDDIEQPVDSSHPDEPSEPQPAPQVDQYVPLPSEPMSAQLPAEPTQVTEASSDVSEPAAPAADPDLGSARDAISAALAGGDQPLPPIAALNAQPLDLEIRQTGQTGELDHIDEETGIPEFKMPDNLVPPNTDLPVDNTATQTVDPLAPPPVPPPLMPDLDSSAGLPPAPNEEPTPPQGDTNNPFNLPPA
jgi:hypothetical protein